MTDSLEGHSRTINIEGRNITNIRFVDDIDGIVGNETELAEFGETSTKYEMKIIASETNINGQQLDTVN